MKVLVGIPVFRVAEQVRECLRSLMSTPAHVVAIDNAADVDVREELKKSGVEVIHSPTNEFCNGGWNRAMRHGLDGEYDIIGIGSSDAVLHPGWYESLLSRSATKTKEVWIPAIGGVRTGVSEEVSGSVAGFFTFMPRAAVELVYPIPASLKHWFGDQYIYEKLRRNGWRVMILDDVRADHQQGSVTARTPEAYVVIEQDKLAWKELFAC